MQMIQGMFESLMMEIKGVKGDVSGLKQDVSSLKQTVDRLDEKVTRIDVTIENEISNCSQRDRKRSTVSWMG